MQNFFTSESVSEGHPDKLADQISDGILDAFLKQDKNSRVACEVFLSRGLIFISGEISSKAQVDVVSIAKEIIKNVGYDNFEKGLNFESCSILPFLNTQSSDISNAVGSGAQQGAGDQGLMFGYAIDETKEYMPLSISMAHQLMAKLSHLRKQGHNFLWPDSKSQVTVRYENHKIKDISHIVISTQHAPDYDLKNLKEFILEELVKPTIPKQYLTEQTKILVNPGGAFVMGGPSADCGLTGRKIIVDTYGGHGSHGGGSFSGKDPSKVDRSGAYIARHIAKNIVAAGLAKKCLVQLSYVIGVAKPVNIRVEHFGTSQLSEEELTQMVCDSWDLKPNDIIQELDLLTPRYFPTATYGHFGRAEASFTWEKTTKVAKLQKTVKSLK